MMIIKIVVMKIIMIIKVKMVMTTTMVLLLVLLLIIIVIMIIKSMIVIIIMIISFPSLPPTFLSFFPFPRKVKKVSLECKIHPLNVSFHLVAWLKGDS